MIRYMVGTEVNPKDVHKAFHAGFIDYIMKVDIPETVFFNHFFGPEGNLLSLTVVAYDGETPIGVVMGGIRPLDENKKTLRCGGLCVAPEYRGTGVSNELMKRHIEMGRNKGCMQYMLEVIGTNERAIKFYEKLGYERLYELNYFSAQASQLKKASSEYKTFEELSLTEMKELQNMTNSGHVNWQNMYDFFSLVPSVKGYCVKNGEEVIAYMILDEKGKIYRLWTDAVSQTSGVALALIQYAVGVLKIEKVMISFPANSLLSEFLQTIGFQKDELFQYEMYLR